MKNSKNDTRVTKSKSELSKALYNLLLEKSLEKVSVIDICERAKINRMTFYNHYQDKYDLFNELINGVLKDINNDYYKKTKDFNMRDNTYDCLIVLAEIIIDLIYRNEKLFINLFSSNEDSITTFMIKNSLDNVIFSVVKEAGFTSTKGVPVTMIISFFSGGTSSLFEYWMQHKDKLSREAFTACVFRGIKAVIDSNVLGML